jgi:hypothetical protein
MRTDKQQGGGEQQNKGSKQANKQPTQSLATAAKAD